MAWRVGAQVGSSSLPSSLLQTGIQSYVNCITLQTGLRKAGERLPVQYPMPGGVCSLFVVDSIGQPSCHLLFMSSPACPACVEPSPVTQAGTAFGAANHVGRPTDAAKMLRFRIPAVPVRSARHV